MEHKDWYRLIEFHFRRSSYLVGRQIDTPAKHILCKKQRPTNQTSQKLDRFKNLAGKKEIDLYMSK
jgi:hypothetical protein